MAYTPISSAQCRYTATILTPTLITSPATTGQVTWGNLGSTPTCRVAVAWPSLASLNHITNADNGSVATLTTRKRADVIVGHMIQVVMDAVTRTFDIMAIVPHRAAGWMEITGREVTRPSIMYTMTVQRQTIGNSAFGDGMGGFTSASGTSGYATTGVTLTGILNSIDATIRYTPAVNGQLISHEFHIPYRNDYNTVITAADRLVIGTRSFYIVGIDDMNEHHTEICVYLNELKQAGQ